VSKLREKGAVHSVQQAEAHIISPTFVVPSSWRLQIPKLTYDTTSFQDGGPVHAAKHCQSGVASGKARLKRCILNHSCGSRILQPPNLPSGPTTTQVDAVPVPPIQALHHSICLLKSHKACNPVSTPVRHTPYHLSGQLITGCSSTIGRSIKNHIPAHSFGVPNKHLEVHHSPHLSPGVPGIYSGHREYANLPSNTQVPEGSISCPFSGKSPSGDHGLLHWDAGGNQTSCVDRASTLSCPTGFEDSVHFTEIPTAKVLWGCRRRLRQIFSGDAGSCPPTTQPQCWTRNLSSHSRSGWGAVCQGVSTGGRWILVDTKIPNQLFGIQGNVSSLTVFCEEQNQYISAGKVRQSHSNYLSEQGSPLRSQLCLLALEIWEWCQSHHIPNTCQGKTKFWQTGNLDIRLAAIGNSYHQFSKQFTTC